MTFGHNVEGGFISSLAFAAATCMDIVDMKRFTTSATSLLLMKLYLMDVCILESSLDTSLWARLLLSVPRTIQMQQTDRLSSRR